MFGCVSTVGTSWHAPSYQWAQRVRKELAVPNTERPMADIRRKVDQAQSLSSVLHSTEVAYSVTLWLYFFMLCVSQAIHVTGDPTRSGDLP